MLNVGNYKQFIFESSLDRDNCVKLSSNIGAGGLPGLSCDRGNSDGDPVWAVRAVPRIVEHLNTSLGFNHCKMWHVCPLCTVLCCPLCTGVMMSSVSSGVLLCWWSHDLWGRHRHTRPRDPEIWGEGHQQQYLPRHDHGTPDHTRINLNHHAYFQLYVVSGNFGLGDFQLSNTTFYTSLEWTLLAIKASYKTTQNCQ